MRQLYTRAEYYAELTARIAAAERGQRIAVAAMVLDLRVPGIRRLAEEMTAAARRGVVVRWVLDAYTFLLNPEMNRIGPMMYDPQLERKLPRFYRDLRDVLDEFSGVGGEYVLLNKPLRRLMNPLAGRCHMKYAVVGDWLAVGSFNLADTGWHDLSVGGVDVSLSGWLWDLSGQLIGAESVQQALGQEDVVHSIGPEERLLVDVGVRGQSVIMDRAWRLIDRAEEHVFLTCQYFPDGSTTARLLAAYRRGVKIELYYNSPAKHSLPNNFLHHGVKQAARLRIPESFFAHELPRSKNFLHAKLLSTEQGAIVGSHNFVKAGVRLGTAELAFETSDRVLARRAEALIRAEVARG